LYRLGQLRISADFNNLGHRRFDSFPRGKAELRFVGKKIFVKFQERIMSERERILVDPKVQWTIAGRVLMHWALFVVCITAISVMVRILSSVGEQPFSAALQSALTSQIPIFGVMLMLLPVFLRDTLKLSNRFAGPMYRLRNALKAFNETGTVAPIKFRTGDFWQEAAADFNLALEQIDQLRNENQALRKILADAERAVEV
jgi:hypothetical protein